ncbi:MAG: hypothetical protein WAL45_01385 [Terracidiphilus sp.]
MPPGNISTILYSIDSLEDNSSYSIGGAANIVEDNGLDKKIEVTPQRLGKIQVTLHVVYTDNTKGSTTVAINVLPESDHLVGFQIDQGFHEVTLNVGGGEEENLHWLMPIVTYETIPEPIRLSSSRLIEFSIDQDPGNPVINLSADGLIRGLRVGSATIVGKYEGRTDTIVVNVQNSR